MGMKKNGLPIRAQRAPPARRGYTGTKFDLTVFEENGQDG
jgi:hypothetical protein